MRGWCRQRFGGGGGGGLEDEEVVGAGEGGEMVRRWVQG